MGFMPANFQPHLQSNNQIVAQPPVPTKQVIRAQAPDQVPAAKFSMPSPEQLGVAMPVSASLPATEVNWISVHQKLRSAGSVSFQTDRTQTGFKFTCMIPEKKQGNMHRFEASAPTEQEAIHQMLKQVDAWLAVQ
jgi:hypothetical protein